MREQQVVLVVDDEPHILSFLAENLASDDFRVHAAPSAAHARSRLNAHRPDIVLLDVGLPDANGFDLCGEIREADAIEVRFDPDVPIIMLTARAEDVDRVRGFQRGADDFLAKPLCSLFPSVPVEELEVGRIRSCWSGRAAGELMCCSWARSHS